MGDSGARFRGVRGKRSATRFECRSGFGDLRVGERGTGLAIGPLNAKTSVQVGRRQLV